uniref:Putative nuclease HARBI1 n=1 Tax=Bactrocera latifrons TaxID=174628 RepID=A0A0K8TZV7_BACLA
MRCIFQQRIYSIKIQVICDHKLRILHAEVGNPGSYHDSKVFRKSHIGRNTTSLFSGEEWIAGDSAYKLTKHLITPYRSNSSLADSERQAKFNKTEGVKHFLINGYLSAGCCITYS